MILQLSGASPALTAQLMDREYFHPFFLSLIPANSSILSKSKHSGTWHGLVAWSEKICHCIISGMSSSSNDQMRWWLLLVYRCEYFGSHCLLKIPSSLSKHFFSSWVVPGCVPIYLATASKSSLEFLNFQVLPGKEMSAAPGLQESEVLHTSPWAWLFSKDLC